jgi:hypothetical protein
LLREECDRDAIARERIGMGSAERRPPNDLRHERLERLRAIGRKGGLAKAAKQRVAARGAEPFAGTMLDMMDAAGLMGASWEAWRTFWRAAYALPNDDVDRERFTRHTGRQAPPVAPVREAWLIVGRRGGKSRMSALAALFQAIRRESPQIANKRARRSAI